MAYPFLSNFRYFNTIQTGISWLFLLAGLAVWITVQSYLIQGPLSQRDQLPEVDDSLAYLTRTQVMDQCSSYDCRALQDLSSQFQSLQSLQSDPDIQRQSEIAGFAFPYYHPLFSAILLSINRATHDLVTAYKLLWSMSPVFLGIAIACFITSIWGRTVAGVTLFLIAFKIFPGTGLHYFTPGNLCLTIALLIWARIIYTNGSSLIILITGSLVLMALHPIGLLYSLTGIAIAWILSDKKKRRTLILTLLFCITACSIVIFILSLTTSILPDYHAINPSYLFPGVMGMLKIVTSNIFEVFIQFKRYKEALYGSLIVLFPAIILGFFYTKTTRRTKAVAVQSVFLIFLCISLFHAHSLTPNAALFFRLLPPFLIILFGAVAHLLCFTVSNLLPLAKEKVSGSSLEDTSPTDLLKNVLLLVILSGYLLETILSGGMQIETVREYMINRQPLSFNEKQPQLLLSKATPDTTVLYTSTMIMAFYFVHDCLNTGAFYYHPSFEKSENLPTLFQQKKVTFAAVYNPTVYHPALAGLDEKNRCITMPEITFSPLSRPRIHGPISREGVIPAKDFFWIEIHPNKNDHLKILRIHINNPGKEAVLELLQQMKTSNQSDQPGIQQSIPADWNGWIQFPLSRNQKGVSYRLIMPKGDTQVTISGISFDTTHFWPWSHNATMTLSGKNAETGDVQLSFNPSDLLPPALKNRPVRVIHDEGSSVLLEFTD